MTSELLTPQSAARTHAPELEQHAYNQRPKTAEWAETKLYRYDGTDLYQWFGRPAVGIQRTPSVFWEACDEPFVISRRPQEVGDREQTARELKEEIARLEQLIAGDPISEVYGSEYSFITGYALRRDIKAILDALSQPRPEGEADQPLRTSPIWKDGKLVGHERLGSMPAYAPRPEGEMREGSEHGALLERAKADSRYAPGTLIYQLADTIEALVRDLGVVVGQRDYAIKSNAKNWDDLQALRTQLERAPRKLGSTPTEEVLKFSADMLDEAAQRLGGLIDMRVMAGKLRDLAPYFASLSPVDGGSVGRAADQGAVE